MCGEVWENVTKNLAQKIAGKSRGDHLNGRDWQQFAREIRPLTPRQVLDRVGTLAKSALAEAEPAASEVAAMPAGTHEVLQPDTRGCRTPGCIWTIPEELGDDPVKAVNKEETAVAKEEECLDLR